MKILQKATLAAAIAAVPFLSANAMQPMDDAFLSDVTGQAGVTIETSVNGQDAITIGSITYTDTDAGGNLVIQGDIRGTGNGIAISGGSWDDATGTFTEGGSFQRQTIDIDENGNLITKTVAIDGFTDSVTGKGAELTAGTAKRIEVGEVLLRAQGQNTGGAQLVSNLEMVQISGASSAHILNLSGTQTFTNDEHNGVNVKQAVESGAQIAIVTKGESRIADLSVDALDGAVGIRNLTYGSGADGTGMIESTQVIWAKGGASADGGGIYIQGSDSIGTLKIGSIELGQASIGSIAITNLQQSGSVTRIYGH